MFPSKDTKEKKKASRYVGVFRAGKKWKSQVQHNGIQNYLGIYNTEEEARDAYLIYKQKQQLNASLSRGASIQQVTFPKTSDTNSEVIPNIYTLDAKTEMPTHPTCAMPLTANNVQHHDISELCPKQFPQTPLHSLLLDDSCAPISLELPANRLEELRLKLRLGEFLQANSSFLHIPYTSVGILEPDAGLFAAQLRKLLDEIYRVSPAGSY